MNFIGRIFPMALSLRVIAGVWLRTAAAVVVLTVLCAPLYAQLSGYAAPRDPDYKSYMMATVEDLMPIARLMAKKPSRRMALSPGYGIKSGDNVLIVVSVRFDDRVLEAIRRALVEAGAKVDIMRTHAMEPKSHDANAGDEELQFMG